MIKEWKKALACVFMIAMLITMSTSLVFAASQVQIINQGSFLKFEVPPQTINGRTMVPMREIFENVFGCSVEWNAVEKSITAVSPDEMPITIQMKIDDQIIYVNGKAMLIDVPPQIVSGRTLVPLKAISGSLGTGIGYDSARNIVVLGLATENPQEVLSVNAQDYTDTPLDQLTTPKTDMFGDIDLSKLYTVPSSVAGYMYEVKGHPYEGQYRVCLNMERNGSIVSQNVSVQKLNMPNMNKKITWTNTDGKTYTHTLGSLYDMFPLLKITNGSDWCLKTFGDVYIEYLDIPGSVLSDAVLRYADKYM